MTYSIKTYKAKNASDAYRQLTNALNEDGTPIAARNEMTLELLNVAVEIENPLDRIIPIPQFKHDFILQESYDILNSNDPRVIHSKQMLEKTMGNSEDPMFFGNELRQAFSRWSFKKILERFKLDKNTRKAVLSLGNRRNTKHTPCMIYAHFIIRDNKLYMTAETRGTAVSMGFINDIYFLTLMQEILLGWLQEYYTEVEMGTFLYKTVSLHSYVDVDMEKSGTDKYVPTWSQEFKKVVPIEEPFKLTYNEYVQEMGVLYHYIDMYQKATIQDNLDDGDYITFDDIEEPDMNLFKTRFFWRWAELQYHKLTQQK
jgi:hypothetical protein